MSVVLQEINCNPAKPACGAAPDTPKLLFPTAAATPAAAVPWALLDEGVGSLSSPQKS